VRKGIFFWHPAYLAMITALIAQLPRRSFESAVLLTIVGLNIYLGASWGDPTFGDSFGCRQIIEMIPLLILPLAGVIERLPNGRAGHVAVGFAVLLAAVNLLQFRGYMKGIVPHNGTTIESYLKFWSDPLG
jgi:hypothetical protein